MDPSSIALTVAWLGAVSRAQSQAVRDLAQQVPQRQPLAQASSLADVIEGALLTAGAGPQQVAPASNVGSGHLVDQLA